MNQCSYRLARLVRQRRRDDQDHDARPRHHRPVRPRQARPQWSRGPSGRVLEDDGQPLADTDADGGDAPALARRLHRPGQRAQDARAGRAEGVSDGDRFGLVQFTVDGTDATPSRLLAAYAAAAIQNARLHENTHRLAVLEERERIGMDLHDGIIQAIYGVGLSLEGVLHIIGCSIVSFSYAC